MCHLYCSETRTYHFNRIILKKQCTTKNSEVKETTLPGNAFTAVLPRYKESHGYPSFIKNIYCIPKQTDYDLYVNY